MKKWTSLLIAFAMLFVLATGVQAQEAVNTANKEVTTVWINGEKVQFGTKQPIVENGVTLVPARAMLETLGYNVSWSQATGIISAEKYGFFFGLKINNSIAYVNGIEKQLAVAPKIKDGTTYVPLRFISETVGYNVKWDKVTRSVLLTKEASEGYIWKVEKDGVVVHLVGSIHFGDAKMYPLRDEIEEAFENSDKLAVEVNLAQAPDDKAAAEIVALQTYSDGTTLKDHLSAETYARVQAFLQEIAFPVDFYDKYKPWAVYLDMTNYLALTTGYYGGIGIDMYYLNRAQEAQKPIVELESYTSQIKVFDSYSKELQERQVNESLDSIYGLTENIDSSEPSIDVLADLWIRGDDAGLEELVVAFEKETELYEKLLVKRHAGMLEKIEGYLNNEKKESYFVVVGYLHMLGKDGLVTLLREKGYTVTRI